MRRFVIVLAAAVLAATLGTGCAASPRSTAFDQFVTQLAANGGLTHGQAVCVATKFFAGRTDQQLKEFFARKDLTDTESAEFARLGTECTKVDATQP